MDIWGKPKHLVVLKNNFMGRDTLKMCRSGIVHALNVPPEKHHHKNRAPLQGVSAAYPMQIVGVDIVGPISPGETNNRYILVASDTFKTWVEVYVTPNHNGYK